MHAIQHCLPRAQHRLCLPHRTVLTVAGAVSSSSTSLYKVLSVQHDVDSNEVKAAYRQLVKAWHPDLFQDPNEQAEAAARLQAINKAYDVLSDPAQRQAYDVQLRMVQEAEAVYAASESMGLADEQLEILKQAMERAQAALQQAIDARAHARQLQREAQLKRKPAGKSKSAKHVSARAKGVAHQHQGSPGLYESPPPAGGPVHATVQPIGVDKGDDTSARSRGTTGLGDDGTDVVPSLKDRDKAARQAKRELQRQQRSDRRQARRNASEARAWAQWQESQAAALHIQLKQELQQPADPGGVRDSAAGTGSATDSDDDDEGRMQVVFDEVQLYSSTGEWLRDQYEGKADRGGGSLFQSMFQKHDQRNRPKGKGKAQKPEQVWPGEEIQ